MLTAASFLIRGFVTVCRNSVCGIVRIIIEFDILESLICCQLKN